MKYEVIQTGAEWVVQADGAEIARFADQHEALTHVAARLRETTPGDDAVSLRMRYEARG